MKDQPGRERERERGRMCQGQGEGRVSEGREKETKIGREGSG